MPKKYATFFTPGRRLPGRRESASGRGVLRYAFVGPESRLSRGWRLTANRPMRPDPEKADSGPFPSRSGHNFMR
jgi:hypothetical protein